MLQGLRKLASGWGAKIFFGLLVFSFAVWGIADVFSVRQPDTVATAGDAAVSIQEYVLTAQRVRFPIESQLRRRLSAEESEMFGLDQAVLAQVTAAAVLDAQSQAMGLGMTDGQLGREIASDPSFQDQSGNFSRALFAEYQRQSGMAEGPFLDWQEKLVEQRQIAEAVTGGTSLPAVLRDAAGSYAGERRTVEYLSLPPELADPVPTPDDAALQSFFDQNKQTYAAPEYRAIDYAILTPQAIADPEAVTDEAIEADYNENIANFRTPERRRIQQLLFSDQAAADAAKAKLDAGTPFADVAADASQGAASTDLGLVTRAEIPDQAVAEAAFGLPLGGVSPVVSGRFGPAIVSVSEIQAEATRPLSEVSDEVRQAVALEQASDQAANAYRAFEDARAGGAPLAEAASGAGLTLQSIRQVDAAGRAPDGQPVTDFPGKQQLVQQAFESDQGVDNLPIDIGNGGTIFFEVTGIEPARDRALDEVRDRVTADWTAAERTRRLDERAAALKAEAEAGKPLADIAAELGNGAAVQTATSITRQSGTAELGQAATAAAFSGGQGLVTTSPAADGAARLLMRVTEVAPPADPAANAPASQVRQMTTGLENDLYSSYVAELQSIYPVRVYPEAIEQAKAASR